MTRALASICLVSGLVFIRRCLKRRTPLIDLGTFRDRTFAVGAVLSFVLGMALFGAIYLLPLFLGIVREHGPFAISSIMIVTGIAQLVTGAPAAIAEQKFPARPLTAVGYALLATGLIWNGFADYTWDFREYLGPQILRGVGFMVCLLPVTRLALGQLPPAAVPNASALFNLMRNIGGAVGLALIDTVVETRAARHAEAIVAKLEAGDREMAAFVGLPLEHFTGAALGPLDEMTRALVAPLVERAAATMSFNEAWLLLGGLVAVSLLAVPFVGRKGADHVKSRGLTAARSAKNPRGHLQR